MRRARIHVLAALGVVATAITTAFAEPRSRRAPPPLDASDVRRVAIRHLGAIVHCFEDLVPGRFVASLGLTARIAVLREGNVGSVHIEGATERTPREVVACLEHEIVQSGFPLPRGATRALIHDPLGYCPAP